MKLKIFYVVSLIMYMMNVSPGCNNEPVAAPDEGNGNVVSYPRRYYIDPENGSYYNTGHSPSQAWESVDRFIEHPWIAGDTILIKRGTIYEGRLTLKGNGAPGTPIVLGSYGGEELPLPEIRAGGRFTEAILIRNVEYWVVQDLKVTNKGDVPIDKRVGIQIEASGIPGGVMNHIHIKRCVVQDVYGTKTHFNGGGGMGIFLFNDSGCRFNDILIEDCHLKDCQRDGIKWYIETGDRSILKMSTGVVFRRNLLEGIPGDQILANGTRDAVIEHNVVRRCAPGDFSPDDVIWDGLDYAAEAAAGIWCMHSDGTRIRYNQVQDHAATWDGQAFDCDQNCVNTLFEYNITYNNAGGFLLICPSDVVGGQGFADHTGTIVRYNISINDGTRNYLKENGKSLSSLIDVVGRVHGAYIYNNVFIKTRSASQYADNRAITFDSYTQEPESIVFVNNIFYNTTSTANEFLGVTVGSALIENRGLVFRNNCVYGYSTSIPGSGQYNSGNITVDPQFIKVIEDFIASNDMIDKDEILEGLRLSAGSPCIGTGMVPVDGGYFPITDDFWGSPIGAVNNIGAYNH